MDRGGGFPINNQRGASGKRGTLNNLLTT